MLIGLRLLQGASGSAAAVFAPGMLRALYGDKGAVGALGALGSVEALAPALAPLAGVWLLSMWGWRASFEVIAAGSLLLALTMVWRRDLFPPPGVSARHGSYLALLNNRSFVGHALGYALTLGGLLVFVFGAPSVFSRSMGLGMSAFIALQMCGILLFAAAANSTGQLVARLGSARVIWCGSLLSAAATLSMLGYALVGGRSLPVIIAIFAVMNVGLGLRGAPGFHAAITAGKGDDARASALVVLSILLTAAVGTSLVAPFISVGLVAIASGAAFLTAVGLAALVAVPRAARST
jgi:MFS family permease